MLSARAEPPEDRPRDVPAYGPRLERGSRERALGVIEMTGRWRRDDRMSARADTAAPALSRPRQLRLVVGHEQPRGLGLASPVSNRR